MLVTGGAHSPKIDLLDSTEIFEFPGGSWMTLTTRLPSPRAYLRAGTANNIVYIFGKTVSLFCDSLCIFYNFSSGGDGGDGETALNSILYFDKTEESWQPAGEITLPRRSHAVQVIEESQAPVCYGEDLKRKFSD